MDTQMLDNVDLPPELYREIAKNLHRPSDRSALLSLSLVNTVWRAESQRIMFKDIWDECYDNNKEARRKWLDTHILFLQAICAQPDRFGPHVHSYGQYMLAWSSERPDCKPSSIIRWSPAIPETYNHYNADQDMFPFGEGKSGHDEQDGLLLWKLTLQALPAFVNLAHLCFKPRRLYFPNASSDALCRCHSQLKSLAWYCSDMRDNFPEFLRSQVSLLHLDFWSPGIDDLSILSKTICSSIVSAICPFSAFSFFATNRNILGYKTTIINRVSPLQLDLASTARLKYLSVQHYTQNIPFTNIILLEIEISNMVTISNLSNLPELRTLVLFSSSSTPDITRDESVRLSVVVEACKRCPKLDRILHNLPTGNPNEQCYSQISITRGPIDTDCLPTVMQKEVRREVEIGAMWWDVYDAA